MLALGCDQAGYELKQEIMKYLDEKGIEYKDCGTYSTDAVDYPVYAEAVVKEILSGNCLGNCAFRKSGCLGMAAFLFKKGLSESKIQS